MDNQEKTQVSLNEEPTVDALAQDCLDKARRAYMCGNLDATILLTKQIIHTQTVSYPEALYLQAKCFYYGTNGNHDLYTAVPLLLTASKLGHHKAQNLLGILYARGLDRKGIRDPIDYSKAFNLFREAADNGKGDPEAMVNEGILHFWGLGTEENPERAVELFKAAAERGNNPAKVNLALCYFSGIGVKRNLVQVFNILKDTTGDATTNYLLGLCYLAGIGVETNLESANELFSGAAFFGAASEGISLTNFYCDGERQRIIQELITNNRL